MKIPGVIATAAILLLAAQAAAQTDNPKDKPATPDWITTTNKPCKVWNPNPEPNESVTWTGPCKDGYANGKGILFWTENGKPVNYRFNYKDVVRQKNLKQNIQLMPGDTIVVP